MECLETKEHAINLVKDVFRSMGGRVRPPRRPGHIDKYEIRTPERDAFMVDFENACLEQNWDQRCEWPTGSKRYEDPIWALMISRQVYPHHSDIDWEEYVDFCENGGGDEWFMEDADSLSEDEDEFRERMHEIMQEEDAHHPAYYDAQTRLRTAYACKDMVRPLSTPLDDRIIAMAHINGQQ